MSASLSSIDTSCGCRASRAFKPSSTPALFVPTDVPADTLPSRPGMTSRNARAAATTVPSPAVPAPPLQISTSPTVAEVQSASTVQIVPPFTHLPSVSTKRYASSFAPVDARWETLPGNVRTVPPASRKRSRPGWLLPDGKTGEVGSAEMNWKSLPLIAAPFNRMLDVLMLYAVPLPSLVASLAPTVSKKLAPLSLAALKTVVNEAVAARAPAPPNAQVTSSVVASRRAFEIKCMQSSKTARCVRAHTAETLPMNGGRRGSAFVSRVR